MEATLIFSNVSGSRIEGDDAKTPRRGRMAAAVLAGGLIMAALSAAAPASAHQAKSAALPTSDSQTASAVSKSYAEQLDAIRMKWGIDVKNLRVAAQGYMLDFRYRVIDAKKAAPLHGVKIKPQIFDADTKARLVVATSPKIGSMRQGSKPPVAGKTYFIVFANPGRYLTRGDRVTVALGDLVIKDVPVE